MSGTTMMLLGQWPCTRRSISLQMAGYCVSRRWFCTDVADSHPHPGRTPTAPHPGRSHGVPLVTSSAQLAVGSAECSVDLELNERHWPEAGPSESHEIAPGSEDSDVAECVDKAPHDIGSLLCRLGEIIGTIFLPFGRHTLPHSGQAGLEPNHSSSRSIRGCSQMPG